MLITLLLYLPCVGAEGLQFASAKNTFESGMQHYESGSYDEAVQQLDIAVGALINIVQAGEKADCPDDALDKAVSDSEEILDSIKRESSNPACDGVPLKNKKELLWKAHVYLGLSKFLSEKFSTENAMIEFDHAKKVLPRKKMDSALFSPKVISFYNTELQKPNVVERPESKEVIKKHAWRNPHRFIKNGGFGRCWVAAQRRQHPVVMVAAEAAVAGQAVRP